MFIQHKRFLKDLKILDRISSFVLGEFGLIIVLVLILGFLPLHAATVTLKSNDAAGTSSFTGATNWSNGAVPSAANNYFSTNFVLRTTNTTVTGNSYTFQGNSLSIDPGGRFLGKIGGTAVGTITVNNLILNGGLLDQANGPSDNSQLIVAGNVNVNAASFIGADGGTVNGSSSFETLEFTASISGSAALQVSGPGSGGGVDTGVIKLSAANTYSGTMTVSNGNGNIIASTVNRILQLNNLNALSNATLNLAASQANPVSFASAANTGAFNLGTLAGTASQALTDTAGSAVALNIGGNNGSGTYAGALTGSGSLTKVGSGTLTLAGPNSYTGGTVVSAGTLQTINLWGEYSGSGSIVLMASSAQLAQTVSNGASAFSGKWIVAGGWLAGANTGALGTNSITVDSLYPLDPTAAGISVAGTALFEPQYDLNSAGTLTLTNGGQIFLHQNCAFAAVVIAGVSLTNGIYSWQNLAARFPANFASNGGGYIAVQPYGVLPSFPAQAPQLLVPPDSQTNFTGMNGQFSAVVYGNPAPALQWRFAVSNGSVYTNLLAGGQFAGVTNDTLSITNLRVADAGSYILVASNAGGSVTSTPAVLTVNGPAVIANSSGLTFSLAADGIYTINSTAPAWTFTGSLGMTPANVMAVVGTDGIGGYTGFQFQYTASASHLAGVRLYTNQSVVLFTDTSLTDTPNDLAFPHLISYPSNLYRESFTSVNFSPGTFSKLINDSPWIFFDVNFNCFILSAATNYMIAANVINGDGSISCGIQSGIPTLPAGFTHRTVLAIQNGITRTFATWGNALTGLSGKVRPSNDATVDLNQLGYWTDNGSAYYYTNNPSLGYTGTLLAVRDQFITNGFPLGYVQLDSWWYPKGVADTWQGDATNNRGGINQYVADSILFPNGLPAFQQQLGLPLITHCRWIDGASPYRTQYAMSANVIVDPAYWTDRMAYLNASGVVTFEHDWLDVNALPLLNLHDPPAFMNDMASSAAANGINMQYCMALPSHFLQGTLYNNLVTMRVSDDRFDISRWNAFLYTSQLAAAVGAWPWTDVYFSSESRNLLISTLSAGPVGVGDVLGGIVVTNLAKSVRTDGVIVKPDISLTPVDQSYVNDAQSAMKPMVAAAYVDHGDLRAAYVFSYAQTNILIGSSFIPSQLGIPGSAYVYDFFNHTGSVVIAGSVYNFSTTVASNNANDSYFVVAPVGPSGIAFLGDTNKFVTLGKKRISTLADAGVLKVTVSFATGETNVTLTGYAPASPYIGVLNGASGGMNYDSVAHIFSLNVTPDSSHTATVALSLTPLPFLQIANLGSNLQIFWPTSAVGFQLESTMTLQSPASWIPVTNPVSVISNQNAVGVTHMAPSAFFRLKQ
jgi:autotransporter-associated beta strand protein